MANGSPRGRGAKRSRPKPAAQTPALASLRPGVHRWIGRLPKLCGADVELGNFIQGLERAGGTGYDASRALLREIRGVVSDLGRNTRTCQCQECVRKYGRSWGSWGAWGSSGSSGSSSYGGYGSSYGRSGHSWDTGSGGSAQTSWASPTGSSSAWSPQDWGRKYLRENGGCCYIDLDHLEVCLPEVISAYDHVAAWHAMLRVARRAMNAVNETLPPEQRLHVLVNNSDGKGNAYGSHMNFLVTRDCWENIFWRKLQYMLYLGAFQVSSIVYAGQGKVGSENCAPHADYQISQRADFFEQLSGIQTTFSRPIINSRDEALCGRRGRDEHGGVHPDEMMRRLHVIFYDSTLCHVASLLKVGVMQIVLAMIEAEAVNLDLTLESPLVALNSYSHDPTLQAKARTCSGRELTAVELQMLFFEEAQRFVGQGRCDGLVPRAGEILALWGDTLEKLRAGDFAALTGRLDWVLKRALIEQAMEANPHLDWESPEVKHLDHVYASLDEEQGLYWQCEEGGVVEAAVSDLDIERLRIEPPADTRAYTRAMLLRKGQAAVEDMNWDQIRFWFDGGYWAQHRTVTLANPLGFTKADWDGVDLARLSLEEALDRMEARDDEAEEVPVQAPVGAKACEKQEVDEGDEPRASSEVREDREDQTEQEEGQDHDGA